jgi:hypothetical protein
MQRASRKSKSIDTRQFDLFAGDVAPPAAPNGAAAVRPATEAAVKPSYEAEVLDRLVALLNRQWSEHLSSNTAIRNRSFR